MVAQLGQKPQPYSASGWAQFSAPIKALNMAIIHAWLFSIKGEELESLNLKYVLKQILTCVFPLLGVFTVRDEKIQTPRFLDFI